MPGADDGARDIEAARAALARLGDAGVTDIVAGVHVDASLREHQAEWSRRIAEIDAAYQALASLIASEFAELRLRRGGEVRLDAPNPDLSDERLRLAGGRFVLVEFPSFDAPAFATMMLAQVQAPGWQPILAHPERYRGTARTVESAQEWRAAGAVLQLNHGSLVGRYGPEARKAAAALLEAGLISYLSSDYHARDRTWIEETREAILAAPNGEEVLGLLDLNGHRLLDEQPPLEVPPLRPRRGLMNRLKDIIGR